MRLGLAVLMILTSASIGEGRTATKRVCIPEFPRDGQTEVSKAEANLSCIEVLHIRKDQTLRFAPDVDRVNWTVKTIRFEENATLDLSAPRTKADSGSSPQQDYPGQAPYCQAGRSGYNGGSGKNGRAGVWLTILGVETIEEKGSLWIRTDGQAGGDGGAGTNGQVGGGHKSGCDGAGGGNGGNGGAGGRGGPTSQINIRFRDAGKRFEYQSNCPSTCAPANPDLARPDYISGNYGMIGVFGAPGCGGQLGMRGEGGAPGEGNKPWGAPGSGSYAGHIVYGPKGSCTQIHSTRRRKG